MNFERNTAEFARQTVLNFRFLDATAMGALRTDLGLSLTDASLYHCREHFRINEGRDPTVRELLFLNAYARAQYALPAPVCVEGIEGETEPLRVFADLAKKRDTLQREGVALGTTLCDLLGVAGEYLSRSGVPAYHKDLTCGTAAAMAAKTGASDARDGAALAAAITPPAERNPYARNLLLLTPTGNAPFDKEAALFMQHYGTRGVEILAAPCDEGMMPHLLALGCGLMLDSTALPCHAPNVDPSAILSVGKNALLLLATDEVMPYLLSSGLPLIAFGCTQPGERIFVRHGGEFTLSVSHTLLSLLRSVPHLTIELPPYAVTASAPTVETREGRLWGEVCAEGGCAGALLALIGEMRAKGADPRRMTLTAALELPTEMGKRPVLGASLAAVLDHHRVCAELALPSRGHTLLVREGLTAPRITLFAVAEQIAPADGDFAPRWQTACTALRFAELRELLYVTN